MKIDNRYLNELTILIVDDQDDIRETLEALVGMWAKKAYSASNGQEGLEAYKKYSPDVIVTDIRMPVMSGLEMIRDIKKEDPDFPIIISTAFQDTSYLLDAIELKVDGYIIKPIQKKELRKRLETVGKAILLEQEIQKRVTAEKEYQDLYDYSAEMHVSVDAKTAKVLKCNQTLANNLGYTKEEIIGEEIFKLYHPDCMDDVHRAFEQFVATGEVKNAELILKRKDESKIDVILNVTSIRDKDNSVLYSRSTWIDISERKKMEKLLSSQNSALKKAEAHLQNAHLNLEKKVKQRTTELTEANEKLKDLDKLKSMFIASMSHELRTPLNSIIGFTGVMLKGLSGELTDLQKDQLKRVNRAGEHLLSLITDVIDISKIEAGRIKATPEQFILNDLLFDTKDEMDILAIPKELDIKIEIADTIQLYTDRRKLFQCLLNYVSNAIKFTDKAGTIEIRVTNYDKHVEISVTDSGIGIKEEDIPKLFEAFERLDTHLKVKTGGTGLGLYLTKKITENLLLGYVDVKSVDGEGSTFSLRIPKKLEL